MVSKATTQVLRAPAHHLLVGSGAPPEPSPKEYILTFFLSLKTYPRFFFFSFFFHACVRDILSINDH
jgi:hypothetical protein